MKHNRGSAMIEASIYLPVSLIVLFIIILLSVIRLHAFYKETELNDAGRDCAYAMETQGLFADRETFYGEACFGLEELPSEGEVQKFYDRWYETRWYPMERRVLQNEEGTELEFQVPLLEKIGMVDTIRTVTWVSSTYLVQHATLSRIAEMYRNDRYIQRVLGFSFSDMIENE